MLARLALIVLLAVPALLVTRIARERGRVVHEAERHAQLELDHFTQRLQLLLKREEAQHRRRVYGR